MSLQGFGYYVWEVLWTTRVLWALWFAMAAVGTFLQWVLLRRWAALPREGLTTTAVVANKRVVGRGGRRRLEHLLEVDLRAHEDADPVRRDVEVTPGLYESTSPGTEVVVRAAARGHMVQVEGDPVLGLRRSRFLRRLRSAWLDIPLLCLPFLLIMAADGALKDAVAAGPPVRSPWPFVVGGGWLLTGWVACWLYGGAAVVWTVREWRRWWLLARRGIETEAMVTGRRQARPYGTQSVVGTVGASWTDREGAQREGEVPVSRVFAETVIGQPIAIRYVPDSEAAGRRSAPVWAPLGERRLTAAMVEFLILGLVCLAAAVAFPVGLWMEWSGR